MSDTPLSERVSLHGQWTSRWSFILAATGAAVGLGNIWRFPYIAGQNGGGMFVLLYLAFVLLIGMPLMMAEILIGRRARRNPVNALRDLAVFNGKSARWAGLGWFSACTLMLILAFYSVVSGWGLAYIKEALMGTFNGADYVEVNKVWSNLLASPLQLLVWHTLFMVLTLGVVAKGVRSGLERATKILMPLLFVLLFMLVLYAWRVGEFKQAVDFLFTFDLSKLNRYVVIDAMGHACFTLAVGAGALLAYGAYLPKDVNIGRTVMIVALLDVLVALLAGLAIFPLVFAYGLPPTEGPGLMFVSLPIAFANIPFGQLVGTLFFVFLFFAAWTSAINLAEPVVAIFMERFALRRGLACLLLGIISWSLGVVSALSFNLWKDVKIAGEWTIFTVMTGLPTNIMLPIGALFFALFTGWVLTSKETSDELGLASAFSFAVWRLLIRYLVPVAVVLVIVSYWFKA